MSLIEQRAYRKAFGEYLRTGTPIRLDHKPVLRGDRYVWRTEGDEKVRPSHRANDGHIFNLDDPTATGHPGTDFNCRCRAIPYVPGETEYASHSLLLPDGAQTERWTDGDFVYHYYFGSGEAVSLAEIGHLREVAEQYAYIDGKDGAFRRLSNQIADEARKVTSGNIVLDFRRAYDFGSVEFSHGWAVVKGQFVGAVAANEAMLAISGESSFLFSDSFEDPVGLGIEVGGDRYQITGHWTATFKAEVLASADVSDYTTREGE